MRLSTANFGALPPSVARPTYDRDARGIGIVHFGIGAFHRAHMAAYTDDAMAVGEGGPELAKQLLAEAGYPDGFYLRIDARNEYAPRGGDKGSATLTLRIPSDDLTSVLDKLKALGDVQEVSLSATDVTMESQDLDARITSMRASIDRLMA